MSGYQRSPSELRVIAIIASVASLVLLAGAVASFVGHEVWAGLGSGLATLILAGVALSALRSSTKR